MAAAAAAASIARTQMVCESRGLDGSLAEPTNQQQQRIGRRLVSE